jgi:hypothetical protein
MVNLWSAVQQWLGRKRRKKTYLNSWRLTSLWSNQYRPMGSGRSLRRGPRVGHANEPGNCR